MAHFEPAFPFDGYNGPEDVEYRQMMEFICRIESLQAQALGDWIVERLNPRSVIDLGCGPGVYLLPYKDAGAEVFGLDACSIAGELLAAEEFERFDLRFPYTPIKRRDLAICFEVAEHLEEHWADRLVDTLWDCAPTILFTGAVPGQGGSYHKNEQPHEYWLTKFRERHGYTLHPLQDEMRAFLQTLTPLRESLEVCGWLIDNSFLLTTQEPH